MVREAELGVVHSDESPGSDFGNSFSQLIGHRVDLTPVGIVLAVFHDGKVDARKLFPEAFETVAVTTIT